MSNFGDKVNFIWKIAELLRGPYKADKYGDIILPMAVLRRFDCLLEDTKEKVVEKAKTTDIEMILNSITGQGFSNKSNFQFKNLLDDPDNIKANFVSYNQGFSANIRERWIIENDLLEGIIALPTDLFYNTGIATYIWVVRNRNNENILNGPVRTGKIHLVDATSFYHKMRKSLGSKRNEISETDIAEITRIYGDFQENEYCKIFDNKEFGYLKVTIERPLRLNFNISNDRIENLYSESAFANLYDEDQAEELELKKQKQTIKKTFLTVTYWNSKKSPTSLISRLLNSIQSSQKRNCLLRNWKKLKKA